MKKAIGIQKLLKYLILCAIIILPIEIFAQTTRDKMETHVYKTRGLSRLKLVVYQPSHIESDKKLPAIIFFSRWWIKRTSFLGI